MKTYPGKVVPEHVLRSYRERAWSALMDAAREEAALRGERVRVTAGINSSRSERYFGTRYTYVIMAKGGD